MSPPEALKASIHQFALPRQHNVIEAAVEEPDGRAANGASVLGRQSEGLLPALRLVAPEDARGGNGDGGPAMRMQARQLPGAIAAQRKRGEVGARRVAVKLVRFLIERGHCQLEHVGIGPVSGLRALRHHDHEGPAVGMIAHCFGDADLRLPHSFGAALAAAVQEEDDRPFLAVIAAPLFRQIDLKTISDAVELDVPIEETGILRRLWLGRVRCVGGFAGYGGPHCASQRQAGCARFEVSGTSLPIIIAIRRAYRKFLAVPANDGI